MTPTSERAKKSFLYYLRKMDGVGLRVQRKDHRWMKNREFYKEESTGKKKICITKA
jgi:hypothetical protein